MRRRWSDRSSRRVRTLVTQLARSRLSRESGRMRADIHDGPEQTLQSEAGYSDARPHQPSRRNLLHRTAGPYNGSKAEILTVSISCPLCLQQQTACWGGDSVPRADHAGRVDLNLERWAGLGRANSLHLDQGRAGKVAGEELPPRAPYLGVFVEVGYVHRDGHDVVHLATRGLQHVLELLEDRLGLGVHVVAGVLPLWPR